MVLSYFSIQNQTQGRITTREKWWLSTREFPVLSFLLISPPSGDFPLVIFSKTPFGCRGNDNKRILIRWRNKEKSRRRESLYGYSSILSGSNFPLYLYLNGENCGGRNHYGNYFKQKKKDYHMINFTFKNKIFNSLDKWVFSPPT